MSLSRECFYQLRHFRSVARFLSTTRVQCALFRHNSPWLLPCFVFWLSLCTTGLPWPYSTLCSSYYWSNRPTTIHSRNKLDVGPPALASVRQRLEYRVASLVWFRQLVLAPAYIIDQCRPVSGTRSRRYMLLAGGVSSQSRLPVPLPWRAALVLLWPRRYWLASLLRSAFYLGHFLTHSMITW